jgi:hypothetical protein
MVTPEKDVAVGGDGAGEDGDGVGNFGVGGGGFNRSSCCVLTAQIQGWRAILSRAQPGELSPAESEKNEPSHAVPSSPAGAVELNCAGKPSHEGEPSRAGLPDGESVAAFPIQSGLKAAAPDVGAGGSVAGGHFGAVGGGGGWALGAGDCGTKIAVAPCHRGASSRDARRCSRWRGVGASPSRCPWSGSTRTRRAMLGVRGSCPSEARAVLEAGKRPRRRCAAT